MRLALLAILPILSACVAAVEPAGSDRIGPSYTSGGGTWSSGGGITAVARVVERDGRTALCGVWMTDRQSALSFNRNEDVMAAASVFVGPERVMSNLHFMRRAEYTDDLTGQAAPCALSSLPWRAGFADAPVALRFPRLTFGDRGSSVAGGFGVFSGDTITFRQTPRPRPIR